MKLNGHDLPFFILCCFNVVKKGMRGGGEGEREREREIVFTLSLFYFSTNVNIKYYLDYFTESILYVFLTDRLTNIFS